MAGFPGQAEDGARRVPGTDPLRVANAIGFVV